MTDRANVTTTPQTLAEWLAGRTDAELVELLQLRPDLTVPVPASMNVLATRAEQRSSVLRAAEEFGTVEFVVVDTLLNALDTLVDSPDTSTPVTRAQVHGLLGAADRDTVDTALDRLIANAIVWGEPELRLTPAIASALPWPAGALDQRQDSLSEAAIDTALAEVGEAERVLLDRLARTSPVGRTRDAAPGTPADRPVQRLLALGLLRWIDEQTVELPGAVGRVLRGQHALDPRSLSQPPLHPIERNRADVDGAAAGEVLELLRHCAGIITTLGETPAPALRAGGLGVRELRRIGKQVGIDEERVGLLVELLAAAGLLAGGKPDPAPAVDTGDDYWAPTIAVEAWQDAKPARRWVVLATAWLDLARRPGLIGMRDPADKPIAALSDDVRSVYAAKDRRAVLGMLAELDEGDAADPTELTGVLAWRRPRWTNRFRHGFVERILAEATVLGVVARGAITGPGRVALRATEPDNAARVQIENAAEEAMATVLPAPVDYVLVQADLTVVAPGPLVPELQTRISQVADVESAGGATVYRIAEATVRRALDEGVTAVELHALFTNHSRTPVPQSLTYLIDDVARRHGKLRAGIAQSFVRCDDPAQLAEVLASAVAETLALRAVAPTVAISQAPLAEVLDRLRQAGFAPAGEDSSGAIVDLRARGARILTRRPRPLLRVPGGPPPEQLARMVVELRANHRAANSRNSVGARGDGSRTGGAATMALLQLAVRVRRQVSIAYVDAQGIATQRIVEPVQVGGGQLDAVDPTTGSLRHFTLHRIASVSLVDQE